MAGSGKPTTGSDQSLGDLVALATKDLSKLVRYEIDLAKTELRGDLRRVAIGGALFGIAGFFVFGILVALFFAYAYLLHEVAHLKGGMTAAYGVVAGTVAVVGGISGFVAWRVIKRMSGMKRTRKSVTEGIGMLRRDGDRDKQGELESGRRRFRRRAVTGKTAAGSGTDAGQLTAATDGTLARAEQHDTREPAAETAAAADGRLTDAEIPRQQTPR